MDEQNEESLRRAEQLLAQRDPNRRHNPCLTTQLNQQWRREQGLAEVEDLRLVKLWNLYSSAPSMAQLPDKPEDPTDP